MKDVCLFSEKKALRNIRGGADCRNWKAGENYKNTQKILEMHETFGYNVTILYSIKYSEL